MRNSFFCIYNRWLLNVPIYCIFMYQFKLDIKMIIFNASISLFSCYYYAARASE